MFAIVIDKSGFKTEFVTLDRNGNPLFYELKDDESIIKDDWNIANAMNKPQWDGIEWGDTEPLPSKSVVEQPVDKMEVQLDQIEDAVGVLATQIAKNTLLQNKGMR